MERVKNILGALWGLACCVLLVKGCIYLYEDRERRNNLPPNYHIEYLVEDTVYPIGTHLVVTAIDTTDESEDEDLDITFPALIEVKLSPQPNTP